MIFTLVKLTDKNALIKKSFIKEKGWLVNPDLKKVEGMFSFFWKEVDGKLVIMSPQERKERYELIKGTSEEICNYKLFLKEKNSRIIKNTATATATGYGLYEGLKWILN